MTPDPYDQPTPEERQSVRSLTRLYEEALVRQLYSDLDRWDRGERP